MFLGHRSPLNLTIFKDPSTRNRSKIGSRWEHADWSEAFEMLQLLVRSSYVEEQKKIPPSSLRKDLILLSKDAKRCLVNRTLFVDALKCPTVNSQSICQIIVHFAYEWKTFSDDVVNLVVSEIAVVDVEESKSYLVAVDNLIEISDSLRNDRVEGLMGGTHGILSLLRIGSESRAEFTLDCVRRILKLMRTHEHVQSYMKECYDKWSWMESFLKDCATRQAKHNELKRSVAMQALSIVTSNMKKYDYSDKHLEACVYALDSYCEKHAPGKNKLNFRDMLNRLRNANRPYEPLFRNLSAQYRTKFGAPPLEGPLPDFVSDPSGIPLCNVPSFLII